jgi:hypothetical protein
VVAARPAAPLTVIESTGDAASVRRPKFDLAARAATRLGLNLRATSAIFRRLGEDSAA